MKKISTIILFAVLSLALVISFAGCETDYKIDKVQFNKDMEFSDSIYINYQFYVSNLPESEIKVQYTVKLLGNSGKELYSDENVTTIIVKKGENSVKIEDIFSVDRSDVSNYSDIKKLQIVNFKIITVNSTGADRLKPYAITISALAGAGTVAMIAVFFALNKKSKQQDGTAEKSEERVV